jgi:CRISPR-associated protein Csx14
MTSAPSFDGNGSATAPPCVCLATLGGQPQIVTLALDALLAQGAPISELIVVHLSLNDPRYQASVRRLNAAFANDHYQSRPLRYRPLALTCGGQPLHDLANEVAADAILNSFHQLIQQLKQQGTTVHLCMTGGRRLLGTLAMSVAMIHFDHADRIWHLYSSDAVRSRSRDGAVLHLPGDPGVRLIRVPAPAWGSMFPVLRPQHINASQALQRQGSAADALERQRCRAVDAQLTPRQREVLRSFAGGKNPQEVAAELNITTATVHSHKGAIFQLCLAAWDLDFGTSLGYRWLAEKFGDYWEPDE